MLKFRFENFLSFIKNKKILLTTHHLVDIDGLVSCFTFKFFLTQYFKDQKVSIYFSELSNKTKKFLKKFSDNFPNFDVSYEKNFDLSLVDVIIILDTNSLDQIGIDNNKVSLDLEIPYIFIDHHYLNEKSQVNELNLTLENYSSTAEIILELFELYNIPLLSLNFSFKYL